jgi:ABC-type Fe3+ transport system substrate-binding protein
MLWAPWAISDEGQRAYEQAGETPTHPHVEPAEKVRPATTYMLTAEEVKEFPKYEKIWKEIFQLRWLERQDRSDGVFQRAVIDVVR